jgi:hypothetical protein
MRFLDLDRLPNQAATAVLDIEALQYLMCVHHSARKDSLQDLWMMTMKAPFSSSDQKSVR